MYHSFCKVPRILCRLTSVTNDSQNSDQLARKLTTSVIIIIIINDRTQLFLNCEMPKGNVY